MIGYQLEFYVQLVAISSFNSTAQSIPASHFLDLTYWLGWERDGYCEIPNITSNIMLDSISLNTLITALYTTQSWVHTIDPHLGCSRDSVSMDMTLCQKAMLSIYPILSGFMCTFDVLGICCGNPAEVKEKGYLVKL